MADSVTVSMGEEMRGVFNVIFLVSADVKSFRDKKKGVCFSFGTGSTRGQTNLKRYTLYSSVYKWLMPLNQFQLHKMGINSNDTRPMRAI